MAAADLYVLSATLLEASAELLATTAGGTPARSVVAPGTPALESCDQLYVHVAGIGAERIEQQRRARPRTRRNFVVFTVTAARCYRETAQATPAVTLESAAAYSSEDVWALWNGLFRRYLSGDLLTEGEGCKDVWFDQALPLEPQAGIVGYTIRIRVELDGYDPDAGS